MDTGSIIYFIGQGLGFVGPVLGVLSYQMKKQKDLLLFQLANSLVFVLHYLMIGATPAAAMNFIGVVRNAVFFRRRLKGDTDKVVPIIFTVITAIVGILTWEEWYSIFVFSGLVIHSFCMALSNAQAVRKSILVTSPLVIIYDCFERSYGGIIYESVAIASCIIGILRHSKSDKSDDVQ